MYINKTIPCRCLSYKGLSNCSTRSGTRIRDPLRDRQNGSPTKAYSQQQCNHNKDCRTETQVLGILLAKEEQNRDSQQNYGKSIRQDKTQQYKHTHKRIIYQAAINNWPKPCRCKEIPVHGNSKIPNSEHFINKEYSYCNQQTGTYFTCKCIILLRKFRNTINKFWKKTLS